MRLALHILGTEVFAITTEPEADTEPGDCVTTPVGFAPSRDLTIPSMEDA